MTSRRSFLISTSALGVASAFGGAAFAQERFEVVHVVGRAEVAAHVFAALDAEGGVVVDGSLLEDAPPAYGYVSFCANVELDLDGYAVIQTKSGATVSPESGAPAPTEAREALSEHCESLEAELDAARRKLAALGKAVESERAERDDAPGALRPPRRADGQPLVAGKKVTGFTNSEEAAVQLTDVVPFLVEDELKRLGGQYSQLADWQPYAVVDGNLVTGQNPASSVVVAQAVLKLLG